MAVSTKLIQERIKLFWAESIKSNWYSPEAKSFYHAGAASYFIAFTNDKTNAQTAEADFRKAMQQGITPSSFYESIYANIQGSSGHSNFVFWDTMYKLIACLDGKGYRSPNWNQPIYAIARASVYQHYWVYNLLSYKKGGNQISAMSSLHVKRAMQYIKEPLIYCTVLSNRHRELIAKNLFNKKSIQNFDEDVRDFFKKYGDSAFTEEKNRMWAYSCFFYENKDLWLKAEEELDYYLSQIQIAHIGGITNNIDISGLSAKNKWIFLTGENGFGKTSVLQAIALGLRGREKFTFNILEENPDYQINITLQEGKKKIQSNVAKPVVTKVLGYGSSRLMLSGKGIAVQPESPIQSLFENNVALRNIENVFAGWSLKEQTNDKIQKRYEQTQWAFKTLLPNLELVPNEETDDITYVETEGGMDYEDVFNHQQDEILSDNKYKGVKYNQLASGFKTIIAVVGDILLNLYDSQEETETSKLKGIVLIDEIDLHLHPKLQKELPTLLSRVFPQVQFIVSTHSPIPLLGAPENSVFLKVNRTKEEGITVERLEGLEKEIQNLLPNLILSSALFGLTNIYPETHTEASGRICTEDSYQEKEFNDQVQNRLKKYLESKENQDKLKNLFKS